MLKEQEQEQNKSTLEYMMHYGALLGIFWIIKYCFYIGEQYWVHFIYLYHLLNIVSPLLMYIFYIQYRLETPELIHNVWRCILFVLGISFFGALFESVIIYAHYAFINPDFFAKISNVYTGIIDNIPMGENLSGERLTAASDAKAFMSSVFSNRITYLILNMMNQLFMGLIFSLLIGFLTRPRNPK